MPYVILQGPFVQFNPACQTQWNGKTGKYWFGTSGRTLRSVYCVYSSWGMVRGACCFSSECREDGSKSYGEFKSFVVLQLHKHLGGRYKECRKAEFKQVLFQCKMTQRRLCCCWENIAPLAFRTPQICGCLVGSSNVDGQEAQGLSSSSTLPATNMEVDNPLFGIRISWSSFRGHAIHVTMGLF